MFVELLAYILGALCLDDPFNIINAGLDLETLANASNLMLQSKLCHTLYDPEFILLKECVENIASVHFITG